MDLFKLYHSPYHVFVNTTEDSPEKLINLILPSESSFVVAEEFDSKKLSSHSTSSKSVFCLRHENWLHFMCTFSYSLWYSKEHKQKLARIKKSFDTLTLFVGDSCHSYGFSVDIKGKPNRDLFVYDNYKELTTTINEGTPFPFECNPKKKNIDEGDYIIQIPSQFGINLNQITGKSQLFIIPNLISNIKEVEESKKTKKPWWTFWQI